MCCSNGLVYRQDPNAMGPGIGPAVVPAASSLPPPPPSLPLPPNPVVAAGDGFTAATVSAAPQPSVPVFNLAPGQAAPVVLPPLHYQGLTAAQPFGYAPPPPGLHPSRLAALGGPPPSIAGTVRSADEMMADGQFGAVQRPRVHRPDGTLWPEETWIAYHPVGFRVPKGSTRSSETFDRNPLQSTSSCLIILRNQSGSLMGRRSQSQKSHFPRSYRPCEIASLARSNRQYRSVGCDCRWAPLPYLTARHSHSTMSKKERRYHLSYGR